MAADYPFPAGPQPCKLDCSDCRFAGFDGEMGTLPTCDGPDELFADEDSDAYDEAWSRIHAWGQSGQSAPCPLWHGDSFASTGAREEFELWARQQEREQKETR